MKEKQTYTISETYELPSKGLVYDEPINPTVELRSMTAEDEMKRLAVSDAPFKVLSDLIENCIVNDFKMHVYDLCIGDYQFLLHKLRVVTYGPDYKMTVMCPNCHEIYTTTCNLDELEVTEYSEEFENQRVITLPDSNKLIELKLQTPRILDTISRRKKDIIKRNPSITTDPGFILTIMSMIKTVDGQKLGEDSLEALIRHLGMKDVNFLVQKATKLNERLGLNTKFNSTCNHCNFETQSTFRITPEFFGPTVD